MEGGPEPHAIVFGAFFPPSFPWRLPFGPKIPARSNLGRVSGYERINFILSMEKLATCWQVTEGRGMF